MKKDFLVIFITCASRSEARRIANALLKKRLIACANFIYGIESLFWWKGRIDKARETLLIAKAKSEDFTPIEKEAKRLHSYECPEIIALPIAAGSKEYLKWIEGL